MHDLHRTALLRSGREEDAKDLAIDSIVRVLDPARAQFYATRGLRIVCPTSAAIETLVGAVREAEEVKV